MFDFGNANDGQRQAISTTEGPVLITAGPGTGKTYTLVQRAIYLIEERGVKPEDIFIATFTEKAAKELITRITNELASRNITVNVNEMYVGTFHSLCLRIIKDHLEYTRLKKNYRLLDTFDQQYLVFRNIYKFRTISGIENVMPKGGAWKWAQAICEFSNNLTEEIVDIDAMLSDHDMEISVIAKVVNTYQAMLDEENLIDFSAIQTECYRLLTENKDILEDLRNSIKYIMVDEYQDTNYIQEQIIFLLGTHENICVVGDDDQGLYRFRGATIRNILEFPSKFDVEKCQIIPLVINYRSDSDIVGFYNKWMITTSGSKFKFEWDKFRYDKRIVANETSKIESPCVVKLASKDDEDEWHERVLDFINRLKNSGKIQDYNEGLPPKMAIFAANVAEATDVVRPAVEKILGELNVSLDTILVNTGDTTVTKNDDIRDFNNLDVLGTEGSRKQFIVLVEKGREGWNCRSLLGIALFRSPKSKIFVLQATMRCLRKLTDEQLKATVFLSKENLDTLDEELRNNYNMEIKDLGQSSDKKKNSYKVRVLPPPRSIKMKRIWHEYSLIEKEYSEPIDFKVSEIDDAKYESKMYEKGSIRLELSTKETVIDDIKNQMRYSRFSLVGEISRYMNLSCVLISRILSEAIDGFDNLVEAVNKHNEVLDDVIIPKIFNTLYEVKSEQKNEDVDVILLKEPKDSGYYEFSADENLVIEKDYNSFTPEEIKKSFHADTYCFDSKPEKECFLQYISSKKVKEIYFTGMFTANQGDLFVQYYDPESKRIRQYYPDFLAKMNDGSYQLIEVKGDNMIDDEVVKAKAEAAEEMSVASGMKYVMYASSVLMKQNVLEHPPVTYSEEPSPLLMVAEDPVPYGK